MAVPSTQPSSMSGLDLIHDTSLTYFIPLATDFKPQEALRELLLKKGGSLDSIESRDSLFFGKADP